MSGSSGQMTAIVLKRILAREALELIRAQRQLKSPGPRDDIIVLQANVHFLKEEVEALQAAIDLVENT